MDKSADAFRTISEVADALDMPAHVLRFWETRFPQIRPVKRAGGRRYYRPSDVTLLAGIKRLLHEDGLTIRGVQKILREQGVRHVAALGAAAGSSPGRLDEDTDIAAYELEVDAVAAVAVWPQDDAALAATATPQDSMPTGTEPAFLWPDAGLPPRDDDGAMVLRRQDAITDAADADIFAPDADPPPLMPAPGDVPAAAMPSPDRAAAPVAGPVAPTDAVPPAGADSADLLIAAVLQDAYPAPAAASPRVDDGWRSLPLAAGEDLPMAAHLRALPRGALAARSGAVAAWVIRARDLTRRMQQGSPGGRGGSAPS